MTLLTDAIAAYLAPLLKKHSAGEPLIWEDLEASRVASMELLKKSENNFVSKRIDDLHQSQVQAYREAAVKGLREWAQSEASLEPMEDNDTESAFVERCVSAIIKASSWPNWRVDSAKMVVTIEIRKRARAIFAKYHPTAATEETPTTIAATAAVDSTATTKLTTDTNQSQNNTSNENDANQEDGEDAADDDGEVEDGEMDDDDQDEDGQVDESETKAGDNKKKAANNSKNKKKKVVVRKKSTNVKPGQPGQLRKGGPTNRGRRPGRGGGAKSG